jgi:hypothetical protein
MTSRFEMVVNGLAGDERAIAGVASMFRDPDGEHRGVIVAVAR